MIIIFLFTCLTVFPQKTELVDYTGENIQNAAVSQNVLLGGAISRKVKIKNVTKIQNLIDLASPGDTIELEEKTYYESLVIDKPLVMIGKGINKTIIIGDTLKAPLIINSHNVILKNMTVSAQVKTSFVPYCTDNPKPTNAVEISNSTNIYIDSLAIYGGIDSSIFPVGGGLALNINNSRVIEINGSELYGGNCTGRNDYFCGKDGGNGMNITSTDSVIINKCIIFGGIGRNGYDHSWSLNPGGFGGNALCISKSHKINVSISELNGGAGGKAKGVYNIKLRAKAGDGAICNNSTVNFLNCALCGGNAKTDTISFNNTINTLGGNGITAINNSKILVNGGNLLFGTSSSDANGKYYYTDSTSLINLINVYEDSNFVSGGVPDYFLLRQNYPNPFNPITIIEYTVPTQLNVNLKVFNLQGKEIKTLVSDVQAAGSYKVEFNGSNLSSGVYFYRLEAGKYSETKKFILLK